MNENLKELLRRTFSVDTEAGYRLRYHITRALACNDYRERINLLTHARCISGVFNWSSMVEGPDYWVHVDNMITCAKRPQS